MLAKLIRFMGLLLLGALGLLWARMVAHSKAPPPEGHWRELDDQALG
jgi:hypothetical protein